MFTGKRSIRQISPEQGSSDSAPRAKKQAGTSEAQVNAPPTVHPFFSKPRTEEGIVDLGFYTQLPSEPSLEHWVYLDPLNGPQNVPASPPASPPVSSPVSPSHAAKKAPLPKIKIAFTDLDGCLIVPKRGGKFPKDAHDWTWWSPEVVPKLAELVKSGYHIVIISNQKQVVGNVGQVRRDMWRIKMRLICQKLPGQIPIRIMASTNDDVYRKPRLGMFREVQKLYTKLGYDIDMEESFFVGDAAGRPGDHNDTDRKWAVNAGLKFLVPEQLFKNAPPPRYPPFKGFDAREWLKNAESKPSPELSKSQIVPRGNKRELVVFLGYPGSGKTTFFKRHFAPADYLHINQDTLGTKAKCTATIREALEDPLNRLDGEADFDPYEDRPRGCVVDNTNRSAATRGTYVRLATQLGIPIRLFHFTASEALARHNDAYRAMTHTPNLGEKRRVTLPALAYITYRNDFEPPTMEEGFDEIIEVDFKFEGRDEQRKQWSMWCR